MYPLGHLGVALLLSAPVGVVVHRRIATGFTLFALLTALLPDVDKSLPSLAHHGVTHTFFFGVVAGVVGGTLAASGLLAARRWTDAAFARRFSPPRVLTFVGLGLAVGVFAHVLGDLVVLYPTPQPVSPFWPVSEQHVSLELRPLGKPVQNALLVVSGLAVQTVVARRSSDGEAYRSSVV